MWAIKTIDGGKVTATPAFWLFYAKAFVFLCFCLIVVWVNGGTGATVSVWRSGWGGKDLHVCTSIAFFYVLFVKGDREENSKASGFCIHLLPDYGTVCKYWTTDMNEWLFTIDCKQWREVHIYNAAIYQIAQAPTAQLLSSMLYCLLCLLFFLNTLQATNGGNKKISFLSVWFLLCLSSLLKMP